MHLNWHQRIFLYFIEHSTCVIYRNRVNIPCLMHDTRLCQLDVKMTNNYHGTKVLKFKTCRDVKNRYTQHSIRQGKRPDFRSLIATWL